MISYLGSLVQFSPAAGRAGRCRQVSLCVGSTRRVPATLGFCPVQGCLCFPVCTAQAPGCSIWSGPCVECGSSFRVLHNSVDSVAPACVSSAASAAQAAKGLRAFSRVRRAFSLRVERLRQPEAWRTLPGCGAPFESQCFQGSSITC